MVNRRDACPTVEVEIASLADAMTFGWRDCRSSFAITG